MIPFLLEGTPTPGTYVDSLKGSRVSINENCADQAASYAASYTVV